MLNEIIAIRSLEDLQLFYFKYKDSPEMSISGILLVVVLCFFIIWKGIIPQTHDWFSIQTEIKATKNRIAQLQANQNIISSIPQNKIDEDYAIAATALPYQKDYAGMIESIDQATSVSNMERNDYSIEVGNLSTKSAQLSPQTTIAVKVSVLGDAKQLQQFLAQLAQELPLSEVVSIQYTDTSTNVEVNFFYKYLPPTTKIPYTNPIGVLSQNDQSLLKTLTSWQTAKVSLQTPNFLPTETASPSGR